MENTVNTNVAKANERLDQLYEVIGAAFISKSGNISDFGSDILNNLEYAEAEIERCNIDFATEVMNKAEADIEENLSDPRPAE